MWKYATTDELVVGTRYNVPCMSMGLTPHELSIALRYVLKCTMRTVP